MGSWIKLSEQMREEYIGDRDNLCIARSGVFISTCNSMGGVEMPHGVWDWGQFGNLNYMIEICIPVLSQKY